jgi:hypothetical protein
MRWDWMIVPGASLGLQLLLDLVIPLLIAWLFSLPRYCEVWLEDLTLPLWLKDLWKYVLVIMYVWFFSATIWHFCFSEPH